MKSIKSLGAAFAIVILFAAAGVYGCGGGDGKDNGDEEISDERQPEEESDEPELEPDEGDAQDDSIDETIEEDPVEVEPEACDPCGNSEGHLFCDGSSLKKKTTNLNNCCETQVVTFCDLGCEDDGDGKAKCKTPQTDGDGIEDVEEETEPEAEEPEMDEEIELEQDVDEELFDSDTVCENDDVCPDGWYCAQNKNRCFRFCSVSMDCVAFGIGDVCGEGGRCVFIDGDVEDLEPDTAPKGEISGTIEINESLLTTGAYVTARAYDAVPNSPNAAFTDAVELVKTGTGKYAYKIKGLEYGAYYLEAAVWSGVDAKFKTGYLYNPITLTSASPTQKNIRIQLDVECADCGKVTGKIYINPNLLSGGNAPFVGLTVTSDYSYTPVYAVFEAKEADGGIPYRILGLPKLQGGYVKLYAAVISPAGDRIKTTNYPNEILFSDNPPYSLAYQTDFYIDFANETLGTIEGTITVPAPYLGKKYEVLLYNAYPFPTLPVLRQSDLEITGGNQIKYSFINIKQGYYYVAARVLDPQTGAELLKDENPSNAYAVIESSTDSRVYKNADWTLSDRAGTGTIHLTYVVSAREAVKKARALLYGETGSPGNGAPLYSKNVPASIINGVSDVFVPARFYGIAPGKYNIYICVDYKNNGADADNYCVKNAEVVNLQAGYVEFASVGHDAHPGVFATLSVTLYYPQAYSNVPMFVKMFSTQPKYIADKADFNVPVIYKNGANNTAKIVIPNLKGYYYAVAWADAGTVGDPSDDVFAPYAKEQLGFDAGVVEKDMYIGLPYSGYGLISGAVTVGARTIDSPFLFTAENQSGQKWEPVLISKDAADKKYKYVFNVLPNGQYNLRFVLDLDGDNQFSGEIEGTTQTGGAIVINSSSIGQSMYENVNIQLTAPTDGFGSFSGYASVSASNLGTSAALAVFTAEQNSTNYDLNQLVLRRVLGPADYVANRLYFDFAGQMPSGSYWLYIVVDSCHNGYATLSIHEGAFSAYNPVVIDASNAAAKDVKNLNVTIPDQYYTCAH